MCVDVCVCVCVCLCVCLCVIGGIFFQFKGDEIHMGRAYKNGLWKRIRLNSLEVELHFDLLFSQFSKSI